MEALEPEQDDLPYVHLLTTLEELKVMSDPLRRNMRRLFREEERTVKEVAGILGESPHRLYYHASELERVGLIRLVRTEVKSGTLYKYFRATARYVHAPFELMRDEPTSERAQAAAELYAGWLEQAALELRYAVSGEDEPFDPDLFGATRNIIRTTPDEATRLTGMMEEMAEAFRAADREDGSVRLVLTAAIVPTIRMRSTSRDEQDAFEADDAFVELTDAMGGKD